MTDKPKAHLRFLDEFPDVGAAYNQLAEAGPNAVAAYTWINDI